MEIYRDKKKTFECNIMVDGADLSNTSARMLLEFDKQTFLFRGKVDASGKCTIEIPALKNVLEGNGNAILEVIADSTIFEAWKSDFILKESKSVKVMEVIEKEADEVIEEKIKVVVEVKEKVINESKYEKPPVVAAPVKQPVVAAPISAPVKKEIPVKTVQDDVNTSMMKYLKSL